jgi:hypothetical protein
MVGHCIGVVAAGVLAVWSQAIAPAMAGELRPEDAKKFVAGKYFSYSCFDGTSGAGRINADGSVVGTIQVRGSGPPRTVALPVGTIRVQPDSICASLRGMPFEPCFKVDQTDAKSFRGSLTALSFAYCDFTRRNPRLEVSSQRAAHPTDWGMLRTSIEE